MGTMAWTEDYSVDIPAIDNEHRILIAMLNDIERLIHLNAAVQFPLAVEALERFAHAVRRHFESEERFLMFNNYPDFSSHHTEHAQLIKRIEGFQQRFRAERQSLNERMIAFLKDWFARHIILHDCRFGAYFRDRELISQYG